MIGKTPGESEVSLRRKIESLTGGHSRIVWVRHTGKGRDAYALGTQLRLMGLDTRDPAGTRPLVKGTGNFSRPLLTPDGSGVVYSNRIADSGAEDTPWKSTIHLAGWTSTTPSRLRDGYAVDCWRDPSTGVTWVYAFTTLRPGRSANPDGYRLIRFPLTDPDKEEPVWEHGQLTGDNIQLNRGGTRASGLIPWPNAGCFDFPSGQFIRYREGCWPSLAPDDSGIAWVFDGSHKGLRLFIPGREGTWRVSLGGSDGISKKAAYHPRWSNHPRLICFTGPYPNNKIDAAGKAIDVVLARFTPDLTRIESSIKLRHSGRDSDYYPDLWVSGAETQSLDPAAVGPEALRHPPPGPPPVLDWIPSPEGLCFEWSRASSPNTIPGPPPRDCGVSPKRYARIGPRFEMLTDGGFHEMDPASASVVGAALSSGIWSLELAATPLLAAGGKPSVLFHGGPLFELRQQEADLLLVLNNRAWIAGAGLTPGQTMHIVIGSTGPDSLPVIYLNGRAQELRPADAPASSLTSPESITFGNRPDGSAPWAGGLETVSFHARPPREATALAHAAWWREKLGREPKPVRTVVRAKLLEASPRAPLESLGAYTRSWTSALYQKTKLLSGPDPGGTFGVAHWTILNLTPLTGPPPGPGTEIELILEPMTSQPQMESEHGSEEVLSDDHAFYMDMRLLGY